MLHSSTIIDRPCHRTSRHQLQPCRASPSSPSVPILEPHSVAAKNSSKQAGVARSIRHEDTTSTSLLRPPLHPIVASSSSIPPRRISTSFAAPAPTTPLAPHRRATLPFKCCHGTASVVSPLSDSPQTSSIQRRLALGCRPAPPGRRLARISVGATTPPQWNSPPLLFEWATSMSGWANA
jgi:hypothetical protein